MLIGKEGWIDPSFRQKKIALVKPLDKKFMESTVSFGSALVIYITGALVTACR